MANERLDRFTKLLKEIFELDKSDLDFGIYRVMNLRKTQIEEFLTQRLPQMVQETLAPFAQGSKEEIRAQMHIRPDDPKIEFYKTIKDLEARLAPTSSGKTIVLNSFIMSGTSPMQLSTRWNMERPAREAKNVYTLDSPDCVELMIDKILQY